MALGEPGRDDCYKRGVEEDFRREGDEVKRMDSPRRDRRSRSRSPVYQKRERARSRSPRDTRPPQQQRDRSRSTEKSSGKKLRVYVRNLPYEAKWMELKDLMKTCGTVEHVEIFTDSDGRSKGCGVVEFTHPDDAARAITEMDGKEFRGRTLRLREDIMDDETYKKQLENLREKSRSIKEQQKQQQHHNQHMDMNGPPSGLNALLNSQGSQQQMFAMLNNKNVEPINCTVFVSNLDYEVNWQTLKDTFRRAGNCVRCDIQQDDDRKSKGFGTVVFEFPFEALTAIVLFNGLQMGNRPIAVRLDRSAPLTLLLKQLGIDTNQLTQTSLIQMQSQATLSLMGVGSGLGSALSGYGGLGSALSGLSGLAGGGQTASGGSALGNLGALSQLLSAAGAGSGLAGLGAGLGASALGSTGLGARSNSVGHGGGYGARQSSYGSRDSGRRDIGPGGGGGGDIKAVFVRNLPFTTTWQDLKDKFRDAGKVIRADIQKDERGKSKGRGTVEYETPEDAQRAVSLMQGMRMDGREIDVKLDRL